MLLSVVESLYNTKGIFKNTSINTLQKKIMIDIK